MTAAGPQPLPATDAARVFRARRLGTRIAIDVRDDSGQALLEYALIVMLVALVAIAALTSIGSSVSGFLNAIATGV